MTAYKTNTNHLPNELYKPDWEELHDFHAERRDRLTKEAKEEPHELFDSKISRERRDQIGADNAVCLKCFDTYQHKTVQDYIEWLTTSFYVPEDIKHAIKSKSYSSMQDAKDYHNQLFAQKAKEEEEAKRSAEWREKMEKGLRNAAPVSKAGPKSKVPDIPSVANNNWPLWERVKDAASSFLGRG